MGDFDLHEYSINNIQPAEAIVKCSQTVKVVTEACWKIFLGNFFKLSFLIFFVNYFCLQNKLLLDYLVLVGNLGFWVSSRFLTYGKHL